VAGGIEQLVVSGPLLLAVPVAAAAGAVTFLSPCCLPLVPGYLSYLTGMSGSAVALAGGGPDLSPLVAAGGDGEQRVAPLRGKVRSRVLAGTLLFVVGFSTLFAVEGVAVSSIGDAVARHEQFLSRILGVVIILLGLMFLGAFDRFTFTGRIFRPSYRPRAGLVGAPLLGLLFGLSWTPCIGPTLVAILLLGQSTGTALRGGLLAFIYGMGLGIPFLVVGFGLHRGVAAFGFARKHARLVMQIGGSMLIIVGFLEASGVWGQAIVWLKVHWFASYASPI